MARARALLCPSLCTLLLCVGVSGCRCGDKPARPRPPDARPAPAIRDAGLAKPPRPRVSAATLSRLLREIPASARWVVAVRAPATQVSRLAALGQVLRGVPPLTPFIERWRKALVGLFGAWPPPDAAWRRLGLLPGGGLAIARLPAHGALPSSLQVVILSTRPRKTLAWLHGTPVGGAGPIPIPVPGLGRVHCVARSGAVVCSDHPPAVLAPARASVAAAPSALPPADALVRWASADGDVQLRVTLRVTPDGLEARARVTGASARAVAGALASPIPVPARRPAGLAALWLHLDTGALTGVGKLLPARLGRLQTRPGRAVTWPALLRGAEARWWGHLGPGGWRLEAARRPGSGSAPGPQAVRWPGGPEIWVCPSAKQVRLTDRRVGCGAAPGATVPWSPPVAGIGPQGASLVLQAWITDPAELVQPGDRARLVAAVWGLPAAERATVTAARALATLLGEVTLVAVPAGRGLSIRLWVRSPLGGTAAARRDFEQAFAAKWKSGGFFVPADLQRLAQAYPDQVGGRLGRFLPRFRFGPVWSGRVAGWLLGGVQALRVPEVSCVQLGARLQQCREALGRRLDPRRWIEVDHMPFSNYRRPVLADLRERAQRSADALRSRCDARKGQLENAVCLRGCLPLFPCRTFVSCLLGCYGR